MSISRTLTGAATVAAVFVAMPLMAPAPSGPVTWYVDDDSCPGGNGSQEDPFCSIQTAIDNADHGYEIVVAPGTYFETINFLGKAVWLHSSDGPEVTIISAAKAPPGTSVVTCDSGEGPDTMIDGFTITGGTGTQVGGPGGFSRRGGGMYNIDSSPTVTNCRFSGNSVGRGVGGGMYNSGGSPTVTDCTFSDNTAGNFLEAGSGGGIFNSYSNPTVSNCTFVENSANGGSGGGMYNSVGSPTVTNCTFTGNTADEFGGGMRNRYADVRVINCTFTGNTGGIHSQASEVSVLNCVFSGNSSSQITGSPPGGECGTCNLPHGTPGCSDSACQTIVCNVYPFCCNTNWSELCADEAADLCGCPPGTTVQYSNVESGWPGTGNIDLDPMFVDPGNGDLHLLPNSPCIDAGHNWAIAGLTDTDLDGNPRFADDPATPDTGCGVPVQVDMGAYEYQGVPAQVVLADLSGDAAVGMDDLEMLLAAWGSAGEECQLADLDLDGKVSTIDLLMLIGNWS